MIEGSDEEKSEEVGSNLTKILNMRDVVFFAFIKFSKKKSVRKTTAPLKGKIFISSNTFLQCKPFYANKINDLNFKITI